MCVSLSPFGEGVGEAEATVSHLGCAIFKCKQMHLLELIQFKHFGSLLSITYSMHLFTLLQYNHHTLEKEDPEDLP